MRPRAAPGPLRPARCARHGAGDSWFVDETCVKVAARWTYLYRAVDQRGQVIDVPVSTRRDAAAREFFTKAALRAVAGRDHHRSRAGLPTRDRRSRAGYRSMSPSNMRTTGSKPITAGSGLRPMRGLLTIRSLRAIAAGHALAQNLRGGHYAITVDLPVRDRVRVAFDDSPPHFDPGGG